MPGSDINRRDFHRLTAAAFGGILAGATLGCESGDQKSKGPAEGSKDNKPGAADKGAAGKDEKVAVNDWLGKDHVCRGLNACKGQGADHKNECAGRGTCASVKHDCSTQNACKFQGGCEEKAGRNSCKAKGSCQVPLMEPAWKDAHVAFEAAMKKSGKKIGDAPPAKAK